jgi:effector protein SdeA
MPNLEYAQADKYTHNYELTQAGIHALFKRMGYADITSGTIYNRQVEINNEKLEEQGFMPILTGVGPDQTSGHWIMLIKGKNNNYYLFDPLGKNSGEHYTNMLANQLPAEAKLSVIPNCEGLNKGLCGYWVASAGIRAFEDLSKEEVNLDEVGQTISTDMQNELAGNGYLKLTAWLNAIADGFPAAVEPNIIDATQLRAQTQDELVPLQPQPRVLAREPSISDELDTSDTPEDADDFGLLQDKHIQDAAHHVSDRYLTQPYIGDVEASPEVLEDGTVINRPNHGLAHTLRTLAIAESIVNEAKKAAKRGEQLRPFPGNKTLADVTPNQLRRIMIAQLFFVAGREDEDSGERYQEYHRKSRKAFIDYIKANKDQLVGKNKVFPSWKMVNTYADVVEDKRDKNGNTKWHESPAHFLVNKAHMIDLLRCKFPAECRFAEFYTDINNWIGQKATDTVFAKYRDYTYATGEIVPLFDPNNKEPAQRFDGKFYISKNDKIDWKNAVRQDYRLREGERYVTVEEYLERKEDLICPRDKKLEYRQLDDPIIRGQCENRVDFCIEQIEQANRKYSPQGVLIKLNQGSNKRRESNVDEVVAANIIRQILANPESIHDGHVVLNGKILDEAYFRNMLVKCDMSLVGSLLDESDIENINNLMQVHNDVLFHHPYVVSEGNVKDEFERQKARCGGDFKEAILEMMRGEGWYYQRLNAIAQNRDSGSSFKEVILSTIMTSLTSRVISDSVEREQKQPPELYRGTTLPNSVIQQIFSKANKFTRNARKGLFLDDSLDLALECDVSNVFAGTNLSTSDDINSAALYASDPNKGILFKIDDPDGILNAKKVGGHRDEAENEFSVYLPEDVALIPTFAQSTEDGEIYPYVVTLRAVKNKAFKPIYDIDTAINRVYDMDNIIKPFIESSCAKLNQAIEQLLDSEEEVAVNIINEYTSLADSLNNLKENYSVEDVRAILDIIDGMGQQGKLIGELHENLSDLINSHDVPEISLSNVKAEIESLKQDIVHRNGNYTVLSCKLESIKNKVNLVANSNEDELQEIQQQIQQVEQPIKLMNIMDEFNNNLENLNSKIKELEETNSRELAEDISTAEKLISFKLELDKLEQFSETNKIVAEDIQALKARLLSIECNIAREKPSVDLDKKCNQIRAVLMSRCHEQMSHLKANNKASMLEVSERLKAKMQINDCANFIIKNSQIGGCNEAAIEKLASLNTQKLQTLFGLNSDDAELLSDFAKELVDKNTRCMTEEQMANVTSSLLEKADSLLTSLISSELEHDEEQECSVGLTV